MATPLIGFQPAVSAQRPPAFPGFGYASWCRSAMTVGGDLCEVVPLSESSLLLLVADVMGKGILAALFASSLRTLIRGLAAPDLEPAQCLSAINRLMFDQLSSAETFITVQLVVADLKRRELLVGNAGHCPLLITDGTRRNETISPDGFPLGIEKDIAFSTERVILPPFASALLYTDGITEARSPSGELFGQSRLERWFVGSVGADLIAGELKRSLLQELEAFQDDSPAADDQSFLIFSDEMPRSIPVETIARPGLLPDWVQLKRSSARAITLR